MSKMLRIIEGWGKWMTGKIPAYAMERMKACSECDFAIKGRFEIFVKSKELKKVSNLVCDKCGCPIITKTASKEEKCPLSKWPKNQTDNK